MAIFYFGICLEFSLRIAQQIDVIRYNLRLTESQSSVFKSLTTLQSLLKVELSGKCWRTSAEYYRPAGLKSGTLSLSPAWFEQGHEVS